MKKLFSLYNRDIYLLVFSILACFAQWLKLTYTRGNIFLTNKYLKSVVAIIGPILSFCLMAYLIITIFYYTEGKKKQRIKRVIFVLGAAVIWVNLCDLLQVSSSLLGHNSMFFALLAIVYSVVLELLKKRRQVI